VYRCSLPYAAATGAASQVLVGLLGFGVGLYLPILS